MSESVPERDPPDDPKTAEINLVREHCEGIIDLPWHHRDPFDRMLIAQAQVEGMTLLTRDDRFGMYGVAALW